jgi:hypothetical protein
VNVNPVSPDHRPRTLKSVTATPAADSAAVDTFMAKLKHPLKADIEAARALILGVSPAIREEIKWNAPGFRTTESFATVNLRSTDRLQFIFHLGAKVRKDLPVLIIPDPAGLMKWLAKDRALVTVGAGKEFAANQSALRKIVRAWLKYV